MPVEFRVLGPLEIRRDGSRVPLRASKQRTLLGALLVSRGRVVSADRLIDALWPAEPPAGARHALEMQVSRLRSLLGDDSTVVARPPGYVLEVDPQLIDTVRFEQLLAEARDAEPPRAASRAADALALWRGEALAEFTFESFAQEEIARLEELRLEAEDVRMDAELALGHDVVGELRGLVAAAPLRERRRGQLMLALYRAGRQADALAVYRDARELLLHELGLEPGDELRELERRILQQDPALIADARLETSPHVERRLVSVVVVEPDIALELDAEEHARQTAAAAATLDEIASHYGAARPEPFVLAFAQEDHAERAKAAAGAASDALRGRTGVASGVALLGNGTVRGPLVEQAHRNARDRTPYEPPPQIVRRADGPFVGRTEELERLRLAHAALVVGPPGIGKSRLLHELGRTRRVVVGRCSSYGSDALSPLRDVAAALGAETALDNVSAAEVPLTFRRLVEAEGAVIGFDDAQWADPIVLETIEHLAERDVPIVCLAREELLEQRPTFLPRAERLLLEPLAPTDAATLAHELGGDPSVVERAEGNPLFIEQLVAHADEGHDAIPTTLQSLLAARLDRLPPAERSVLEHAAVAGREFAADLVEGPGTRAALAALARRGFLDPAPPSTAYEERFRFRHALIHEAAYGATPRATRSQLHEELADRLVPAGGSDELVGFHLEQAALLRPERDRHAERLAEDAGRRLASAGMSVFKLGYARRAAELLERALELLPDGDATRGELLCELAVAARTAGDERLAQQALRTALDVSDNRIRLRAQIEEAALDYANEAAPPQRLVELARAAEPVFEALRDDRALGRLWLLDSWIEGGALGHCRAWELAAERALEHYRRIGFPTSTCVAQIAAALYHGPAPVDEALARLHTLLETVVDDIAGRAAVGAHLGGLHAMRGDPEAAAALASARAMYEELGRPMSLLFTVDPLEADAARFRGDLDRAATILEATCGALRERHNASHYATHAAALSMICTDLERPDEAVTWAEESRRRAVPGDVWAQVAWRAATAYAGRDGTLAAEAVALAEEIDLNDLRARSFLAAGDRDRAIAEYRRKGNAAAASRVAAAART
jgi:DNA-binding SARP family transcriptional activator